MAGASGTARRAAVLGSPIAHSLSPALHRAAYRGLRLAGWSYDAIECDEQGLPALLDSLGPEWAGLSLTMPLKRAVLPLLDDVEPLVAEVGAANTVVFTGGQRRGFNTDVGGIVTALSEAGVTPEGNVVVLGNGATACSALAALRQMGATDIAVAVRAPGRAEPLLARGRAARRTRQAHRPRARPGESAMAAARLDDPSRGRGADRRPDQRRGPDSSGRPRRGL